MLKRLEWVPHQGVVTALPPPSKSTDVEPSMKGLPDRVLVSTYVLPLERVHLLTDMVDLYL